MKNSVVGYPRIGIERELKFFIENYFKKIISKEQLIINATELRKKHLDTINASNIDFIPSNDFSFYDNVLDVAVLLNAIPKKYKELNLCELDTYFAMARGYQSDVHDAKALPMKKWFNTNYHYIVPEIEDDADIKLNSEKPFLEYSEALKNSINTKPVIIGPFTFLKLANYSGNKNINDFISKTILAYKEIIRKFNELNVEWIQFDEPFLVTDLSDEDKKIFTNIYKEVLAEKNNSKILLQTYFGDIRDIYNEVIQLDFDGIGLDFNEGSKSLELIEKNGFPSDKKLFVGIVNGKNIWKNNYSKTLNLLDSLSKYCDKSQIVIGTSCSLLHVPYTLNSEIKMDASKKEYFAFAEEKLVELSELKYLFNLKSYENDEKYINNCNLHNNKKSFADNEVKKTIDSLKDSDFIRTPVFSEREKIQGSILELPLLPTTTIGSFPQTLEVKSNRRKWNKGEITDAKYSENVKIKIAECIAKQEEIGLDVIVHGEFERNDMVEYFGENLEGYIFTEKAWVQSYGTRCVKPPIIWGDIKRTKPITVEYSVYAQSLTKKPVKGMLTGPITILNWSFPREDVSNKEMALQIALAIKDEVLDLEKNGIKIIQIDEAALREKLPIRSVDWDKEYFDWAIPAFRLVHAGVKKETQIHTHMCYSEFSSITNYIDDMDTDVISIEASRSNHEIIESLKGFKTQLGLGVYDIHSPRVPSKDEMLSLIVQIIESGIMDIKKLWINPDCGLKTRGEKETWASLKNLVDATKDARAKYGDTK